MSSPRPSLVALIVACAFFMESLDGTVIATALPQMAVSFGTGPVQVSIGMTAYLLTLAIVIPVSSWMADRFGARRVFCAAIALFTLASVWCGFSHGVAEFTVARVFQGIGGAMMSPVGRLVVLRSTEKKDLLRALALITWPGLAAPVIGPPLGGFITTYASWRWIFFLNVPIGLVGVALVARFIANHRGEERRPFDGIGFVLVAACLVCFMYGLDGIGHGGRWLDASVLLAAGFTLGALAVRHLRRRPHPLLDLSTLRVSSFSITLLGGAMFRVAIGATPFLLPLLFQEGFGVSAFVSGMLVLAYGGANLGMKSAVTFTLRRFGFRPVLLANGSVVAVSIVACGWLTPETPLVLLVAILLIAGASRSMQFTSLNTLVFADIGGAQKATATALFSMVMQLCAAASVAFGSLALQIAQRLRGAVDAGLTIPDFRVAFAAVALVAVAGLLYVRRLAPDSGAEVVLSKS